MEQTRLQEKILGRNFSSRLLLLIFWILGVAPAWAQLSPGDLHQSHADLEGLENCTKCHLTGKKISPENCLACHKLLKERIDANRGLHANPEYRDCVKCHVDHHGRDFDLIYWEGGQENFDHRLTGYPLEGAHTQPRCRDCHKPDFISEKEKLVAQKKELKRTFLGLKQACLNCHVDEHRGQLDKDCLSCHQMEDWKPAAKFDHDKTRFPLTGKHSGVDCQKCHKTIRDNRFPDNPTYVKFTGIRFAECSSCHRDVHEGRFGNRCSKCHVTGGWEQVKAANFDHSKTRFPLKGKHQQVKCESCHKPGRPYKGLKFAACRDCHQDYHKGQFAHRPSRGACEECHTERGFSPSTFTQADHQKTDFPLKGAHLAVPCIACHTGEAGGKLSVMPAHGYTRQPINRFQFASIRCRTCHEDPHRGQVDRFVKAGGCESCHRVDTWKTVKFDHSQTQFALTGRHRNVACNDCHKPVAGGKSPGHLQFQNLDRECRACHKDVHQRQFDKPVVRKGKTEFVTDCSRCHTPNNWEPTRFNHDRDSRFPLEGAHENVPCQECHKPVRRGGVTFTLFTPVDGKCSSCHGS